MGISADFLKLIENKLGIRFQIVQVSSWDEAMSKARTRQVDMLSAATKSAARSRYLSFTTPHIELPGVIIVQSEAGNFSNLDQFRGKKVGVVSGYVWQEWIARDHPGIELRPVRDMQTGLQMVSFGQLDAMVGNLATATYNLKKLGITNLRVAAKTGYFARLAIASRNDWPHLNAVLQKAVSAIEPEETDAIHDRWIKLESGPRLDTRTILLGLAIIIAVVALAVAGNLFWNYSLRQRVRQQNRSLRESEERYRMLTEASPEAILVTAENRMIVFANTAAKILFAAASADQLIGMNMLDLVHPDDREDVEARRRLVLEHVVLAFAERRRLRLDGSDFYSESRGVPFTWNGEPAILIVVRDITERKQAEAKLRQAQKMEAVGQLTGGVAHDFNNLLTIILGNAELLKSRVGGQEGEMVDQVTHAARRGAELTHRLLAFSRQQSLSPRVIAPDTLVAGMTDMLQRTLGETIEIETRNEAGLWRIEADRGQLENALLNLAINARDAMPNGGCLILETANITLEEGDDRARVAPGDYVTLSVADTGCGMSAEVLNHAFEPFFTTKDVGEGSGLGLSMIYGFVAQSGGDLKIDSALGVGTKVTLFLPREKAAGQAVATEEFGDAPRGRGETVLLVEDEFDVRTLTATLLGDLGYQVLEAANGAEAVAKFDAASRIDLVVTDLVMPGGMSGAELVHQLKRRRHDVKALFVSGYPERAMQRKGLLDPGTAFLKKPFARRDLALRVRGILDDGAG